MDKELLIVSGMSGAGKTQVMNVLEDIGYFCADNVPPVLIAKFAALPLQSHGKIGRVAVVVDVRSKDAFCDMIACLESLRADGVAYKLLFLDCEDATLEIRYKETRRRHPLLAGDIISTAEAMAAERVMLAPVYQNADYIIDTTLLSVAQLKGKIRDTFAGAGGMAMGVSCMSFGFKYGLPRDCDLVFDVRCLPNPFYLEELRPLSGQDKPVDEYVLSSEAGRQLLDKLCDLLDFLVPMYIQEGKSQLVIAFGCTGGHHRSVVFAEHMAEHVRAMGLTSNVFHRDIRRQIY